MLVYQVFWICVDKDILTYSVFLSIPQVTLFYNSSLQVSLAQALSPCAAGRRCWGFSSHYSSVLANCNRSQQPKYTVIKIRFILDSCPTSDCQVMESTSSLKAQLQTKLLQGEAITNIPQQDIARWELYFVFRFPQIILIISPIHHYNLQQVSSAISTTNSTMSGMCELPSHTVTHTRTAAATKVKSKS